MPDGHTDKKVLRGSSVLEYFLALKVESRLFFIDHLSWLLRILFIGIMECMTEQWNGMIAKHVNVGA